MGDVERWIAEQRRRNTSYRDIRSTLRSKGYTSREIETQEPVQPAANTSINETPDNESTENTQIRDLRLDSEQRRTLIADVKKMKQSDVVKARITGVSLGDPPSHKINLTMRQTGLEQWSERPEG